MNKLIGFLWLFILMGLGIFVVYLEINQGMDLEKLNYAKMILLMMALWVILFTKKIEGINKTNCKDCMVLHSPQNCLEPSPLTGKIKMRKIEKIIENAVNGIKPTKKEMESFHKWYKKEFGISAEIAETTGSQEKKK